MFHHRHGTARRAQRASLNDTRLPKQQLQIEHKFRFQKLFEQAVHNKNMNDLNKMIASCIEIASLKGFLNIALTFPAKIGHIDVLEELLAYPELSSLIAVNHNEILCIAVEQGHSDMVDYLLTIQAVVDNIASTDPSVVRLAAANGHINIINRLLSYPCLRETVTHELNTALRAAAFNKYSDMVNLLLTLPEVVACLNELTTEDIEDLAIIGELDSLFAVLTFEAAKQLPNYLEITSTALDTASQKKNLAASNYLLEFCLNQKLFNYAEEKGYSFVDVFVQMVINNLDEANHTLAPGEPLDVDPDKIDVHFQVLKRIVRANSKNFNVSIEFYLQLPAMHAALSSECPPGGGLIELLKIAHEVNNIIAIDELENFMRNLKGSLSAPSMQSK